LTEQKQAFSIIKQRSKLVAVFYLACRVFKYWESSHKNTDFWLVLENGQSWHLWVYWVMAAPSEGDVLGFIVPIWSFTSGLLWVPVPLAWSLQESQLTLKPYFTPLKWELDWPGCCYNLLPWEHRIGTECALRGQFSILFLAPATLSAWNIISVSHFLLIWINT
jgi:hypothetical protein